MNRREFLGRSAVGAVGLSACSELSVPSLPAPAIARGRPPRTVLILGAGLAGLIAGDELVRAGHDVAILEARARPGGRVQTLRDPFSDGLHAEAGALLIPSGHALTLEYARRFSLPLEPATPLFEARLFYVRGKRVVAGASPDGPWPFELTPEERQLGRLGMWNRYVGEVANSLGDVAAPGWLADPRLEALDAMSVADFLRMRGASPGAVALLRVGYFDLMGDGIDSYSALFMLQRLALRRDETQRYTIKGGNDLLPRAFAERLRAKIRYASPVTRIEPGETSVAVLVGRNGRAERLTADHVVCTLPFSVLRGITVSPSFSSQKTRAIAELAYTSVTRVFLQFRKRAWRSENLYIAAATDRPIGWVFEHTVNQPGVRGILEAQAVGRDGRRLARMTESDRVRLALSELEQVFPSVGADFERATSKSWDDDPWARGAFAYFRPGQMRSLVPHIARAERRVHFAGDHTSPWSGWMQGALESGLRAAREITDTA